MTNTKVPTTITETHTETGIIHTLDEVSSGEAFVSVTSFNNAEHEEISVYPHPKKCITTICSADVIISTWGC